MTNGLTSERFSSEDSRSSRQDITQYIVAWFKYIGRVLFQVGKPGSLIILRDPKKTVVEMGAKVLGKDQFILFLVELFTGLDDDAPF